jgi:hypothetical protein
MSRGGRGNHASICKNMNEKQHEGHNVSARAQGRDSTATECSLPGKNESAKIPQSTGGGFPLASLLRCAG